MSKLIGAIFILIACGGMGFAKSAELQSHLHDLEEIKKIFCFLKSEMQYTRAPFAEIFEKITVKVEKNYQEWLREMCTSLNNKTQYSFYEIWKKSIEEHLKHTYLKQEDLEELKIVGKSLEYTEGLDLYLEQIEYKIKNTREMYQTKQKLCRSMGIMAGIFLVVLLL